MATKKLAQEPTRPRGEGFSQQEQPPPVLDFHDATPEQLARAFFAAVPPPDPSKRRKRPRA